MKVQKGGIHTYMAVALTKTFYTIGIYYETIGVHYHIIKCFV